MKKSSALGLITLCFCLSAEAQGTVLFENYFGNPATDPAVYFADGVTRVRGPNYVAGLMAGPSAGNLTLVATTPFSTDPALAGFFLGGVQAISSVSPGSPAWIQLQFWDSTLNGTTTGATFAQAQAYSLGGIPNMWGVSSLFSVAYTGNPLATPPVNPSDFRTELNGYMLLVPEPGPAAFLGLACVVAAAVRRAPKSNGFVDGTDPRPARAPLHPAHGIR
ncbi:MAG TPA: hypothetical protein VG167_10815 [Verrucomicrobiae bacterium]|nr:hypothetical protein [Verrucomicrobiae bacterium]